MAANDSINENSETALISESRGASRPRSGFCCGCLVATVVLSIIFILVLTMLFSSPGEIVAFASRSLGRTDTVAQASNQLTEAQIQAMRGVKPTVQVQLSDADVNAYLAEHREEIDLPSGLQAPRVAFGQGYIEGSVRARVAFVPVRVRVKIVPEVVEGQLVLHIEEMKAGKIGLPGSFRKQMTESLNKMIEQKLAEGGAELTSIEVSPGLLTITAVLQPSGPAGG